MKIRCIVLFYMYLLSHINVFSGYASSALQQCATPFLGNFKFHFQDTLDKNSTGNITACDTLNSTNVVYETGSSNVLKVAFSGKYQHLTIPASKLS